VRALVIGASGQVGAKLVERLEARGHETTGTYAQHPVEGAWPLDIADPAAVEHVIAFIRPDWVFCPGALTHVDYCEEHPEEAFAINRDGPLLAARMAKRVGAGFVYYSTDYVFDGACGPYGEDDPPNPLSQYGRSKLEGERAVLDAHRRSVVIRTTWVYGPDRQEKNFVYQVIRACRNATPMRVPADQISSPTYAEDLAAASVELAERDLSGIYHVAGEQSLDRHAFAVAVCEMFGLEDARLDAVLTAALGQRARRPLRAGLRIDKARSVLTTPLRGPRAGLEAMRQTMWGTRPPSCA
jgi:dTDP-4-dehydrorhamnose reductase